MADAAEDVASEEITRNRSLQADEVAALSAIYEDSCQIVDAENHVYEFHVVNSQNSWWSMTFQVHLPSSYPTDCAPIHRMFTECMNDADLFQLSLSLQEIWEDNLGECVLYLWIEEARRALEELSEAASERQLKEENAASEMIPSAGSNGVAADPGSTATDRLTELTNDQLSDATVEDSLFQILSGEPIFDRKSTFQAHIAGVHSLEDVDTVMRQLKTNRKIQHATHNIMAYRIQPDSGKLTYLFDCDDDGEYQAGGRLKHLLHILNAVNIVVIVSRWYGGIQLGPDRFKHINNCARDVVVAYCKKDHAQSDSQSNKSQNKLKLKRRKK